MRAEDGAVKLGDSASSAADDEHGRMWAGARREEQSTDHSRMADRMPRLPRPGDSTLKRQPRSGTVCACRVELDRKRPHNRAGRDRRCLSGQWFRRPEQAHWRDAVIRARNRSLMRDLYPAVIIGSEGSAGLPAQGVGISLSCRDGYRPSWPEPPKGDFDLGIDRPGGLVDDNGGRD